MARDARERAEKAGEEDLRRLESYVEAAQAAVLGLAQEREQILAEGRASDLSQESRQNLRARIDLYLHTNRLRPELERAITGLNGCADTLEKQAGKVLQWPWQKGGREDAVRKFRSDLASLLSFLNSLGERLKYEGPSGIGVQELQELDSLLRSENSNTDRVENLIAEARERGNREWADQVTRLTENVERLRGAFR
jgi:hypothetical protein